MTYIGRIEHWELSTKETTRGIVLFKQNRQWHTLYNNEYWCGLVPTNLKGVV